MLTIPAKVPWGARVVVKLGGAALQDEQRTQSLLDQLTSLRQRGVQLVVVHGGGPAVSKLAEQLGIHSRFHQGLRVTPPELMRVAQMVQVGVVGRCLVSGFARRGVPALGLSGADFGGVLRAELHPERALGRVGLIAHVELPPLRSLIEQGTIPVLAPVAVDANFEPLNVNADQVAQAVAVALGARQLIYVSDVAAVLGPQGAVEVLTAAQAKEWLEDGTVHGGMRPKLLSCLSALEQGVGEVIVGRTKVVP